MSFKLPPYVLCTDSKIRKAAKIRNRYNQVPHLTRDTTWESDKTQLNITNECQEVSPFPAGDHKASLVQDCVFTLSSEKGPGRTLVRSSGSEKGSGLTLVRQVRRKEGAKPWFGRFGVRRKDGPNPGSAGSEFGEKTGLNPGSAGSEFGERNGPNPGSAGSEFGERTWPNSDSEFGFGVRK